MASKVESYNQSGHEAGKAGVGQYADPDEPRTNSRGMLKEWIDSDKEYPSEKCLHELFEEQVARTPLAIAVCCGERKLTYAELNERANHLAHSLRGQGVSADVRVGLLAERSLEMLIGLLGILKAGAAYVPMNPDHPKARLLVQLEESQSAFLVTQQRFLTELEAYSGEKICVSLSESVGNEFRTNPERIAQPQNLAYVIYTSGSTGTPKGVAVTHEALVNYTAFICHRLKLDEVAPASLSFATVSTISADLGNTCIFPSLVSGGCLHILSYEMATNSRMFADYVSRHSIDVLKIVPSHLESLLSTKEGPSILPRKYLIVGGEAFSWQLAERISRLNAECKLINHYGPTETTIGCLTFPVEYSENYSQQSSTVPIGHPIANAETYILDHQLKVVPPGVSGELYVGGVGLARGYLNNTEQTAERFIPNPFSSCPGARLYKTGDTVRCLSDGNMEFLGRTDCQIKIRGYRIEPGEVQVALLKHASVYQAFVTAREDKPAEKKLVAYIVPSVLSPDQHDLSAGELRNFLKDIIPEYMVPSAFVALDSLPLTSNGKIDRHALPPPEKGRPELEEVVTPRNSLELELLDIWEKVLAVRPIGMRNDFFELGGDSLSGARLFAQIEDRLGKRLPLALLFRASTIEKLANTLQQEEWTPSWSSLVAIQPEGSKPPLFCVHACGAHVFIYRPLVRHLSVDQPVYGLQALGLDGRHEPFTRVPDMAAHYVKEIRKFRPQGPYYLLGDTLGGLFAFEMARQLHDQGQKVALLAMVDTICPLPLSFVPWLRCQMVHLRQRGMRQYLSAVVPAVRERLSIKIWKIVRNRDQGIGKYLSPRFRATGKTLKRRVKKIVRSFYGTPQEMGSVIEASTTDDPVARTELAIAQAVLDEYSPPKKAYPGRITYFLAQESLYRIRHQDNRLDWNKLGRGGLEVHEIPGGHDTAREEPYVGTLAEKLVACLERARNSTRGHNPS